MGDSIFYYVLILAALCCLLPYNKQKFASSILLVLMMLLCGFRAYDVGVDTHNYVEFARYNSVDNHQWGPIFWMLKLVAGIFPDPQTPFLMLMTSLTFIPLAFLIKKYSEYPALSVLMFIIPVANFYVQTMNIARQSIAIVFVLWASVMIANKKNRHAVILLVLAFLFHPYTFPSFILLFLDKIKLTSRGIYITLTVSILAGLVGTLSGIQNVLNMMMLLTADSQSALIAKLGKYGDYDIESNFSIIGQLSHMLPLVAMCLLGINRKTLDNIYYKLMYLGCIATNVFVSVIFCERIASTFTIAQLFAVPYIYKYSNQKRRILIVILLLCTAMLFIYNLQGDMQLDIWVPYHTIFD